MYDRRSRFNPSPSTSLPPYPSASGTLFPPLNDNGRPFEGSFSRPRRLSTRALESHALHVADQFEKQARERVATWLSEAQMMRQLKRTAWKVQTREERLVQDLNVVRAAIGDMLKAVEVAGAGLDDEDEDNDDTNTNDTTVTNIRQKVLNVFKRSASTVSSQPSSFVYEVDRETQSAAKTFLLAWETFINQQFRLACDAVLTCRNPVDTNCAYDVLARIVSIRATAVDKLWFEDLPSLGEKTSFGGLKLLGPRAKAVVWAVAELYRVFKAEKRARRQGAEDTETFLKESWISVAVETGEYLQGSVLFDLGVNEAREGAEFEVDPDVVSLCESFHGMSINEEENDDYFTDRTRRRSLREKIDRVWEQGTGYLRDNACTSS